MASHECTKVVNKGSLWKFWLYVASEAIPVLFGFRVYGVQGFRGSGPVIACDELVPFGTSAPAALALRCRQPVRVSGVSSERLWKALHMLAHWLGSEEGFSGLPRAATDREDDRGIGGPGRATIRGFCQAPELREIESNASSGYPLTHCLFAAFAVLVPPHFGWLPC